MTDLLLFAVHVLGIIVIILAYCYCYGFDRGGRQAREAQREFEASSRIKIARLIAKQGDRV